MFRLVTLVAAVLTILVLGGCADANRKAISERQTVQVPQYDLESAGLFDKHIAPSHLRAVDACATLRATDLSEYGKPGADAPSGLGSCSHYMRDHNGQPFSITLKLDDEVFDVDKHRIGGLPSEVSLDGKSCNVRSAYRSTGSLGFLRGLQILLQSEQDDPCSPAVQMMSEVITTLRTNPPISAQNAASLASVDPCAMLGEPAVRAATGGSPAQPKPDSMYACEWDADNGVSLRIKFDATTFLPGTAPTVDIGGAKASVRPSSPPQCDVEWEHRPNVNSSDESEVVQVEVSNSGNAPLDPCNGAIGIAKAVRATLPAA